TRNEVDYVVTEYGIARLRGKNLRDRARELIKIAHPDFREDLKLEYENRFKEEFKMIV
ncbi:4-hydroxybutyrate CoA-transferase, partial [Coprococcus sp. MSK.21.13]|nr:4-hydroxybutyrate CoA-transferase [Coprococcus sp. MSK.21.13]